MIFKNSFVKELKELIPENIKKLNLIFPRKQSGYARFNKDRLDSIYLDAGDKDDNGILLKFKLHINYYLIILNWNYNRVKLKVGHHMLRDIHQHH